MNPMKKTVLAMVVMAAAGHAMAADSVDVKVIGTITPAACTPVLSGGGTVDYGTIKANTLSATDYTVLDEKLMDISITCDAPTKVAVKAINGRPGSVAGATEGVGGFAKTPVALGYNGKGVDVAGLGMDGTSKVGGYNISFAVGQETLDGVATKPLVSIDNGATWTYWHDVMGEVAPFLTSFGDSVTKQVQPFTTMNGKLSVFSYINKASELDLTKPVQLDGLTTLEMVYL